LLKRAKSKARKKNEVKAVKLFNDIGLGNTTQQSWQKLMKHPV
jgi:hypothetical protein